MRSRVRSKAGLKPLAVALIAVLLALCLGGVAQAALAPVAQTECAMCSEQSGCGVPATPPLAIPATVLPAAERLAAPEVAPVLVTASGITLCPDRPVVPLAPRSPPRV